MQTYSAYLTSFGHKVICHQVGQYTEISIAYSVLHIATHKDTLVTYKLLS